MGIVEFDNVGFTYDGERYVLRGLDLAVEPGEFVCVLGGNGSGKSTLAQHVNALLAPDEGTVRTLGFDTADPGHVFDVRRGAGLVFQNPDDQLVASLIENDVAFGPENLGVRNPELRERVTEALSQVGLAGFERKETSALSGGQKQRVAIAGVLAMRPQVLVLDEASAMLDPRGRAGLLRVVRELHEAGLTIVMITHFMEEAALADRVVVLDGGRVVLDGPPDEVLVRVDELERLALDVPFAAKLSLRLARAGLPVRVQVDEDALVAETAAALGQVAPEGRAAGSPSLPLEGRAAAQRPDEANGHDKAAGRVEAAPALIEFDRVSYSYAPARERKRAGKRGAPAAARTADWGNDPDELWALRDITFSLMEGEFLGVAGHTGSGKSTLVQHMNGLVHPHEGRVLAGGTDLADARAAAHARADVGLVFQYPEHQLFAATVFEDVTFGPRNQGVAGDALQRRYEQAMALVDLPAADLREKSPFELSGGQQRRVAFAGVLAMAPRVLILDEPVAGLDPRAREDFLRLIERLHRTQGLTVVMVSHSMDDLARLADRVLVLNRGRVHALGTPAQVFRGQQAMKDVGLGLPAAQRVGRALQAAGAALPDPPGGLFTLDSLACAVLACAGHPAAAPAGPAAAAPAGPEALR